MFTIVATRHKRIGNGLEGKISRRYFRASSKSLALILEISTFVLQINSIPNCHLLIEKRNSNKESSSFAAS